MGWILEIDLLFNSNGKAVDTDLINDKKLYALSTRWQKINKIL